MVSTFTSAIVVALSVIALAVLLSALRKSIKSSAWNSAALLGALSVVLFSSVYLVLTYSSSWDLVTEQNQDLRLKPQWGNYLIMLVGGTLAAACAVICFRAVRRNKFSNTYNPAAVLALALLVVSVTATFLNGDNPIRPATALMLAVLAACTVAPRGLGVHVGIGTICVIAAVTSGFAIAVHKDFSVMPCPWDKCGVLGFQFRGIFQHPNTFAIFLTLAMPFVYIGFASWEGPLLSTYLLGLVLLSGSRSAAVAAVLTFVLLIVVRPSVRRPVWAPKRTTLLYLVLGLAFVVGVATPLVVNDPDFLTGRGHIWMLARGEVLHPATFFQGIGMLAWKHVVDAGMVHISASYSVHNQWLQVLYSAGLIGFILFVGVLALLIWQAGRTYCLVIGCVLLPVFLLGVSERPWPIDSADWVIWVVPGALLSYPVARRSSDDRTMENPDVSKEPVATSAAQDEEQAGATSRCQQSGGHTAER